MRDNKYFNNGYHFLCTGHCHYKEQNKTLLLDVLTSINSNMKANC